MHNPFWADCHAPPNIQPMIRIFSHWTTTTTAIKIQAAFNALILALSASLLFFLLSFSFFSYLKHQRSSLLFFSLARLGFVFEFAFTSLPYLPGQNAAKNCISNNIFAHIVVVMRPTKIQMKTNEQKKSVCTVHSATDLLSPSPPSTDTHTPTGTQTHRQCKKTM